MIAKRRANRHKNTEELLKLKLVAARRASACHWTTTPECCDLPSLLLLASTARLLRRCIGESGMRPVLQRRPRNDAPQWSCGAGFWVLVRSQAPCVDARSSPAY